MGWLTALKNELAHERDVFASYLPSKRTSDFAFTTIPDDLIGRVVRSGRAWEGWLTPYLIEYSAPDLVSLDVGANIGVHTRTMAAHARETIALEPQKTMFEVLLANTADLPNVRCMNVAASSFVGESSLAHRKGNRGASRLTSGEGDEQVQLLRLDDLEIPTRVGLMKIDVEGHEAEVLDGATRILTEDRPIIILEDVVNARHKLHTFDYTTTRISWHDFACIPIERGLKLR